VSDDTLGGASTTEALIQQLRIGHRKASPRDRQRIRNLAAFLEGDEDRGPGRPPHPDEAALSSIDEAVARGVDEGDAILFAANEVRRHDKSATLHSVRDRLRRKRKEMRG
jgi:hypothetical protein